MARCVLYRCQYQTGRIEDDSVDFTTYGEIAYAAAGNFGKYFTTIQVYATLVGVGAIFVVLCMGACLIHYTLACIVPFLVKNRRPKKKEGKKAVYSSYTLLRTEGPLMKL